MNRRDFLRLSSGFTVAFSFSAAAENDKLSFAQKLRNGKSQARLSDSSVSPPKDIEIRRNWDGEFCKTTVVNHGHQAIRIKEIVISSATHGFPAESPLYGDSFQMLSQTGGTLGHPVDLGYSELRHYKIPQPEDATVVSGLLTLSPQDRTNVVLAFTSCRRFIGRFYLRNGAIEAVLDTENLELGPGESWELEEFMLAEGPERSDLLAKLAARIGVNHPTKLFRPIPTGWCSWYCFGPRVTAQEVLENLEVISKSIPDLKYIQIDDGYQPAMGDWLETGKAFGGDVVAVLKEIKKRGFEPAIWVAPFVAEQSSHVFQQRPEWFIRGADDKPLVSSDVTFGGWRRGPWYALDGTHPVVQQHFEELFSTMRRQWGCSYFKLDANFWGAMHGGRFHDPKATRIQAYRRGMEAIRRGAGDSFILGCNHPIWPSFGLIDGSRSSGDIKRSWPTFKREAFQTMNRNWQNGRLWWNDPDAVLLTGDLPDEEFQSHATAIYASGGMVLSGDDLTRIAPERLAMLKKLLPSIGVAADFENEGMDVGFVKLPDRWMACLFNWDDAPKTLSFRLQKPRRIRDYWSGKEYGIQDKFSVELSQHSARLLECR